VDPSVTPCCSSLKKEAVLSDTDPGSEPVTEPEEELGPNAPSDENAEIDTLFVCVPPPAMRSNASVAPVPASADVSSVMS
jgi:hypothetical protein